jgi:hypothetical protein
MMEKPIKPVNPGDPISAKLLNEGFSGPGAVRGGLGVKASGVGRTVTISADKPALTDARLAIWAKITGYATISGQDNRWRYSWEQQSRTEDGWMTTRNGLSGTTTAAWAINSIEANNSNAGVQGNSVDLAADVPATITIKPVQGNPVVRLYIEIFGDGVYRHTFEYINGIDVECQYEYS